MAIVSVTSQIDTALTISIVSYYNEVSELCAVVESLLIALDHLCDHMKGPLTIAIVDNSEDNILQLHHFECFSDRFQKLGCEFKIIQGQGNVGYGAAHNLAISFLSDGFHLLMNADIALEASALTLGTTFLSENPDVAAVSPAATYEDGSKQYLCKRFPTILDFFIRGFIPAGIRRIFTKRLSRFEMHDLHESTPNKDIPIVSGCFMLCRNSALRNVAGFNEDYFLYFEDFDLSMRLNENNALAYLPSMKITHRGGNSAKKGIRHIGLFVQSGIRFFNTYGWRWL